MYQDKCAKSDKLSKLISCVWLCALSTAFATVLNSSHNPFETLLSGMHRHRNERNNRKKKKMKLFRKCHIFGEDAPKDMCACTLHKFKVHVHRTCSSLFSFSVFYSRRRRHFTPIKRPWSHFFLFVCERKLRNSAWPTYDQCIDGRLAINKKYFTRHPKVFIE